MVVSLFLDLGTFSWLFSMGRSIYLTGEKNYMWSDE
jgi:hypothetical protein